jgi:hypothetical protein
MNVHASISSLSQPRCGLQAWIQFVSHVFRERSLL